MSHARSGRAFRWILLLGPAVAVASALGALSSCHPAADGSVSLVEVAEVPLDLKGGLTLEGLRGAEGLAVRVVNVRISGDEILVDGRKVDGETLALEAPRGGVLSFDREMAWPDAIRFHSPKGSLAVSHEARASGRGFDIDFLVTSGPMDIALLFAPSQDRAPLVLSVTGYRTEGGAVPRRVQVRRNGGSAAIRCRPIGHGTRPLSIHYLEEDGVQSELFPRAASHSLTLMTGVSRRIVGATRISAGGKVVGEFDDTSFRFVDSSLAMSKALVVSRAGLSTRFSGRIGQAFAISGRSRQCLLPSALARLTPAASILAAVIAYLLDKVVMITRFVKSGE
jgi:hypothetical protein